MARSPKEDPIFNDMQHNTWNYRAAPAENCAPGALNERHQPSMTSSAGVINDNSVYTNANNFSSDVYLNKNPYNIPAADNAANKDDNVSFNNAPNIPRVNCQNYGNAMLNLGNGQLVRVFYDENNQHLIVPMSGQYELFNHNQGLQDMQMQASQPSHLFTLNQEYSMNNNSHITQPSTPTQNKPFNNHENVTNQQNNVQTSNFLKEVITNWLPNSSGTYSPFGQNFPLNHPDAPLNLLPNTVIESAIKPESSPKRNENSPLADTSNKKRIVAEVKPMRPSYSDVLAKNAKNPPQETVRNVKPQNLESKPTNNKANCKSDRPIVNSKNNDETKHKSEKKQHSSTISSGSESGDVNSDDIEKIQKPNKKSKNKQNISRKWSSLDNVSNEDESGYNHSESQFMFIETQMDKPHKKKKKSTENQFKNSDKNSELKMEDEDDQSEFVYQENQEGGKIKKKKETRTYYKVPKPVQDKKKGNQTKWKRNKPGYLGLALNYLEHWGGATWKAIVWFLYLLSDICRMSAHLSFDLCTSVFTQTYVSSQAVWRSSKDWLYKLMENKYLLYIDRKLGHTRFGFWRKFKWFKKEKDTSEENDSTKLNSNIPLPATGDEAMKRLLACKGKDPYSILGVSVTCSDEEIKRYYRRQAFLVHPDKNQQPGAEEAFKILQHAFELIGEPELRLAYSRRAAESRHAEAAWSELSSLLAQLHDKMEFAANTIRCTNCGRRHKRVVTERPCYAARYCAQCKIRHSAKEGDIWAESSMMGLLVMYYACMDGAVYQITQWASCQKKNLKQLRPDCHVVQYRIVLGNKATHDLSQRTSSTGPDPNLEEFLNNLYSKSGVPSTTANSKQQPTADAEAKKRRTKKPKA